MLIKILLDWWNVRGLGLRRKRDDVRAAIETALPSILYLQEIKLSDITTFIAFSFLPQSLRSLGISMDSNINEIDVSTRVLMHMEFDRVTCYGYS
jgi:hypothetical protein